LTLRAREAGTGSAWRGEGSCEQRFMTHIDLYFFDGCPSWQQAWRDIGTVLAETGIDATVRLRDVMPLDDEARSGFAGSPTIHVDGVDLEGYAGPGVLACRRYEENGGRGWPSLDLLRARLGAGPPRAHARAP